ncbi:Adenosine deaminase [Carabus blaptoides fortunei]
MADSYFRCLPKIELHAHLNGSLSAKTLKNLSATEDSIQQYLNNKILDSSAATRTLDECFDIFKIAHRLTNNATAVTMATRDVIAEFAADGVIYLELRTTPRRETGMTKRQYIDAVIVGITTSTDANPGIDVTLILSLDRTQTMAEASENVELALEYGKTCSSIVRGIDVSGDPSRGTWFEALLKRVRAESNLKITVHCGEVVNEREIDEILDFKPDRIGHGTCILPQYGGSERLWQKLQAKNIPVECCLTSNVKTRTITTYAEHHLKHLIEANHPFTLATDDKGVFTTSLSHEYAIAASTFNLETHQLEELCYKTINYTFLNADEKHKLKTKMQQIFNNKQGNKPCKA